MSSEWIEHPGCSQLKRPPYDGRVVVDPPNKPGVVVAQVWHVRTSQLLVSQDGKDKLRARGWVEREIERLDREEAA